LKTYTISIAVNIRGGAHEKGKTVEQNYTSNRAIEAAWRKIHEAETFAVARLLHLLARYEQYLKDKQKEFMAQWPPHSIFCERRCCEKSMTSYVRYLKRNISWGADGHIK
jgi:hypothetical protein